MTNILIGSHVEVSDPFTAATSRNADVVQVNLSAPQTWRTPTPRRNPEAWLSWNTPVYVHAPYLLNPSSINPEQRAKTRTALQAQCKAAAEVGALGVIVHGGHPTGTGTLQDAVNGWVEVLSDWTPQVPVLIENTAGGKAGPARTLEGLKLLYSTLRDKEYNVGFCLDTCHAHAGGLNLETAVADLLPIVGRIDLVHANDSRDEANSGRDRHTNFGEGNIPVELIAQVCAQANAPVVVETPGGVGGQTQDIQKLRDLLAK